MRKFVFLITAGIFLFGCAHYMPRAELPPDINSIAVPVFINNTDKYGLEQYLTSRTIDEFLTDGKVDIAEVYKADAVVKGIITKYVTTPILFDSNQVPQQYRMRIYIDLSFFSNKEQVEIYRTEDIWEETTYYVVNNLGMPAETEETARVRVLDNLAAKVVRRVIYGRTN
ncbi:MAG: LPS assembly lipoprotein LptE [Candidatus Goldiibacteriota bacterium]